VGGVSDADEGRKMSPNTRGQSSALRRGRLSEEFASYSVTKVVESRLPVLADPKCAKVLLNSWNYLRSANRMRLLAFCIMPEHFHFVFRLLPNTMLSKLMEDTSKFTAREINKSLNRKGRFWQNGFHDHRCRNENELHDLCLYVEHNPVRKGLVTSAEQWPYSSASSANKVLLDRDWWS
jgi:REP-associated tyrosine transposase